MRVDFQKKKKQAHARAWRHGAMIKKAPGISIRSVPMTENFCSTDRLCMRATARACVRACVSEKRCVCVCVRVWV